MYSIAHSARIAVAVLLPGSDAARQRVADTAAALTAEWERLCSYCDSSTRRLGWDAAGRAATAAGGGQGAGPAASSGKGPHPSVRLLDRRLAMDSCLRALRLTQHNLTRPRSSVADNTGGGAGPTGDRSGAGDLECPHAAARWWRQLVLLLRHCHSWAGVVPGGQLVGAACRAAAVGGRRPAAGTAVLQPRLYACS